MFVAIYEFKVKPGEEEAFVNSWHELTSLIYEFESSLGSRLHRTDDPHLFVAYAQWPDRATWENSGKRLPEEATSVRHQMSDACESIQTTHKLEVAEDLLADSPFKNQEE
ncbi:MAG: antibiotic biosynthesis monooxygenase [Planctomycetota bacterium]